MNQVEYIVGIYNYFDPSPTGGNLAYYFLYLLDQKGILDFELAKNAYKEKYQMTEDQLALENDMIGPFESSDSMNQFAFFLCEKLDASKINLFSVAEYNALLESTASSLEFERELRLKGNQIENIERKKKGLLSKFFS
jgi:hypothetical protein